ncbi:MAG: MarR family winged helix-turn-helix transcriptional regulator [Mycolicibacterium sp.]|uniref:MarR family winged helix-turn-helix transcriptional regulator n=1 Tax=Mycolicibacterium sp. TaxID=2320850 RepID=UPI003D0B6DFE
MPGTIGGRTASDTPGLDIAEQRAWHNFLDAAHRVFATINRALVDEHDLTLHDVRLLELLARSPGGAARMGDLAEALTALPSRVTRQIHRLEKQGLVTRAANPGDGRGVLARITPEGRGALGAAMKSYGAAVRTNFLDSLTRPQVTAMSENCRKISAGLRSGYPSA